MKLFHGTNSIDKCISIYNTGFHKYMGNYGIAAYFTPEYDIALKHYARNIHNQVIAIDVPDDKILYFNDEKDLENWYKPLPNKSNKIDIWLNKLSECVLESGYYGLYVDRLKTVAIYDTSKIKL